MNGAVRNQVTITDGFVIAVVAGGSALVAVE
jgi:hypothetical protein